MKRFFLLILLFLLSFSLFSQINPTPEGFVLIEAGSFTMGSPADEEDRDSDEAQHQVYLTRDFYMSKTGVTQGEWESVMGFNPSNMSYGIGSDYPVNMVSWYDAVEYCNALSRRDGLTPVYGGSGENITCDFTAKGYRLHTEAEWEYAARGGQNNIDYRSYAGSDSVDAVGWYSGNSDTTSHPVGGKQANDLGLYDMSGNVWEWCWDWYYRDSSGTINDPAGPALGSSRVARGAGWGSGADSCRSANRYYCSPGYRNTSLGFRLVCNF
jgi:sulfatase modifying factor 1